MLRAEETEVLKGDADSPGSSLISNTDLGTVKTRQIKHYSASLSSCNDLRTGSLRGSCKGGQTFQKVLETTLTKLFK